MQLIISQGICGHDHADRTVYGPHIGFSENILLLSGDGSWKRWHHCLPRSFFCTEKKGNHEWEEASPWDPHSWLCGFLPGFCRQLKETHEQQLRELEDNYKAALREEKLSSQEKIGKDKPGALPWAIHYGEDSGWAVTRLSMEPKLRERKWESKRCREP